MNKRIFSKILPIITVLMLISALNVTGIFGTTNLFQSNNYGYGYGYSNNGNGFGNNSQNSEKENINNEKINESIEKEKLEQIKKESIENIIFETEIFKNLVKKLNDSFFDEIKNAEILEKIQKKQFVSKLKEKYLLFLIELKKYENNNSTKENVKIKLEEFVKIFLEYRGYLEKNGYFIKLENVTVYVPYFENEVINKIIIIINHKLKKVFEKKVQEKKVKISKLYSKYLLSFKLKIEINKSIGNNFTVFYLNKLFLEINK